MKVRWKVSRVLLLAIVFAFLLAASFSATPASAAAFTNCAAIADVPEVECDALVALYDNTNGASWTVNTNWKTTDTVCNWSGITCDAGGDNVKFVNLGFRNLDGPFAGDFTGFSELQFFNLRNNNLTGTLSDVVSAMPASQLLDLTLISTELTGAVPDMTGFTSLSFLGIADNSLTGTVEATIGNLPTTLQGLEMGQNNFTGTIPASFGLNSLNYLNITGQGMTGDFSTILGYLPTTISTLNLSGNTFTGTIPAAISGFSNLIYLNLNTNSLIGDMTTIFPNFPPSIEDLYLAGNDFTGTIPASVSNYTSLENLSMSNNQLDGEITTAFNNFPTSLSNLSLFNNDLTGTIPASVSSLTNLAYLYLQGNMLAGDMSTIIGNFPPTLIFVYLANNDFTGSIPASIQNLTILNTFSLEGNSGMSGTIAEEITNLGLFNFNFLGTNLCEPESTTYHDWKNTITFYKPGDCLYPLNGSAYLVTTGLPIVAIARPHIGTEIMAYSGIADGTETAFLPMLFNDKWGYTSTFTIQNTTSSPNTFSVIFKDAEDGSTTCEIVGESLLGNGVRTYDVSNLPSCDGGGTLPTDWFGGATIISTSTDPLVAVARVDVNGTDAVAYNAFTTGANTAYLPMLFRGKWGYQSAFYIQNLSSTDDADISIDFYDSDGNFTCTYDYPDPIAPSATKGIWMAGIPDLDCDPGITGTGFDPAGWAGNAVINTGITGSDNVVAIARPHMGSEVAAYSGSFSGSSTNYLPMLFRNQWGYDAAIYIQNLEPDPSDVTIEFYDTDGNYTCAYEATAEIGGYATKGYWTPALQCTKDGTFPSGWAGSATVTTSKSTTVIGRPHLSDGQVVAYNGFEGGSSRSYVPLLFRSFGSNESALYVQNLDTNPVNVEITFYDEETGEYCTLLKNVGAKASGAIWLANLDGTSCTPFELP